MNSSGYAVVEVENGSLNILETGLIKPNTKNPHGDRLVVIRGELLALYDKYLPTDVTKEKGFARFIKATQTLYKAYGVTEELFAGLGLGEIPEYSATTIKKVVTGNGKGTKADVEAGVRLLYNLPDDFTFDSNDESDALAVAYTHAKKMKYIK